MRSLNLATSTALALGEALRQTATLPELARRGRMLADLSASILSIIASSAIPMPAKTELTIIAAANQISGDRLRSSNSATLTNVQTSQIVI